MLGQTLINFEVQRREANFILFEYRKVMSFIFFIASIITMIIYCFRIYKLRGVEVGALKALVFANLVILVIYNFFYSIGTKGHWASNFLDNLINSLMMSCVLFLNLVLLDAQTHKIEQVNQNPESIWSNIVSKMTRGRCNIRDQTVSNFFVPKVFICFGISFVLHFFMFTHNARLFQYIT